MLPTLHSIVLLSCLSLPALADQLPSLVSSGGWPEDIKGNVLDMEALRFTTSLQGEFVFLIGDKLFLARNAGRYEDWLELASNVVDAAVLPYTGGTQKLMVVTTSGPATLHWNASQNQVVTTGLTGTLNTWGNVKHLWVQERNGTQRVYGYDVGAGKMRLADHTQGVWVSQTSFTVPADVRDLDFVEMDDSYSGEELVLLKKYELEILDDTAAHTVYKATASPTDAVAVLRNLSVGSGDLLAWTYASGGSHYLKVWNEDTTSTPFALGSADCTAILPREDPTYGEHMLLSRGGLGDVDLVQVTAGSGNAVTLSYATAGDTFDTHNDTTQRPIQMAVLGDFDLDGLADMALSVQGADGVELKYVMTTHVEEQTLMAAATAPITLTDLSGNLHELSLEMELGSQMASHKVELALWAIKDPSNSASPLVLLGTQLVEIPSTSTDYTFEMNFDTTNWDPTEAQFYPSFVPVDTDSNGTITAMYPVRNLGWSEAGASHPVVIESPEWQNDPVPMGVLPAHGSRPKP